MTEPTDDEIRADIQRAVVSLRAATDRAIDHGDRALSRDVARHYRKLLADAAEARSQMLMRIATAMADDGDRIRRNLGSAGWDEPEAGRAAPTAATVGFRDESTGDRLHEVIERLHDSEIGGRVAWHGFFEWSLGDDANGFIANGTTETATAALRELGDSAAQQYPDSEFARWWRST